MKPIHWFSIFAFVAGVALFMVGSSAAGALVLLIATGCELLYAALTGKQRNDRPQ